MTKRQNNKKTESHKVHNISNLPDAFIVKLFRKRLINWFKDNKRDFIWRHSDNSYEIILAELFLQQTNANTVAKVFPAFLSRYPTWGSIAIDDENNVQNALVPLGLYRRRSVILIALSKISINLENIPATREKLEKLPGIGQYIASVLLVTIHGKHEPFLDVNMARVLERFFGERTLADIRYDPYLQELSRKVVNVKNCLEINWAILDFAALICSKRSPKHECCPLKDMCKFYTSL